jgi:hypothetical protein
MSHGEPGEPEEDELGPESGIDDEGVLDASDTLQGDPGDDPLDQGILPADRWSPAERYGATAAEEEAGESLDQLLAEEEPDVDPYAEADQDMATDATAAGGYAADPRAGRLVAPDQGTDIDTESDLVASDVGIDAGAASAEEAAVHVLDSGSQDATDESPDIEDPER